jgi:three-Cys-motif partner protein
MTQGMWTAHKLYFLCSYLAQVVQGMHGNAKFPGGLCFVDCFAGAGVCESRDADGLRHRLPGSSLIAAAISFEDKRGPQMAEKHFDRIIAVERDHIHADALRVRLGASGFKGLWEVIERDFNDSAGDIAAVIPSRSLVVAFVDPYSLDVHFSALQPLAGRRSLDLIILFSDRIDLQRNVEHTYYGDRHSKLDAFLGKDSEWRKEYERLSDHSGGKLCEMFANLYLRQLKKLGYSHGDHWSLDGPNGPMFRLVFASKNPLGLKYCDIARKEDYGGEVGLYG